MKLFMFDIFIQKGEWAGFSLHLSNQEFASAVFMGNAWQSIEMIWNYLLRKDDVSELQGFLMRSIQKPSVAGITSC